SGLSRPAARVTSRNRPPPWLRKRRVPPYSVSRTSGRPSLLTSATATPMPYPATSSPLPADTSRNVPSRCWWKRWFLARWGPPLGSGAAGGPRVPGKRGKGTPGPSARGHEVPGGERAEVVRGGRPAFFGNAPDPGRPGGRGGPGPRRGLAPGGQGRQEKERE